MRGDASVIRVSEGLCERYAKQHRTKSTSRVYASWNMVQCLWFLVSGSRATMAHIRQSRPDSGVDFKARDLTRFKLFPLQARI